MNQPVSTYSGSVELCRWGSAYYIYRDGEQYLGPLPPEDAAIAFASVHEVLARHWVQGKETPEG